MAPLLIVFGPLFAAAFAGFFGNIIGHRPAQIVTTGFVILSALLSMFVVFPDVAFGGHVRTIDLGTWINVGEFQAGWAIKLDTLSAVMLVVVTSVSSLVHVYSWGYMSHDPHRARFFAYLSLFTFTMLALVTADNFLQLFFGWEGVGLASYLLIGFWYKKKSANNAAIKAFVTNRVGDFGLALGIMALFMVFGTVEFGEVFAAAEEHRETTLSFIGMDFNAIELITFLLFIGAMGKSAQFFLHVWLPDAMEGPTPVSALIHAATMVTAGVFLVVRCSPLFEMAPMTSTFVTVIGGTTALFAATVGMAQNDIKRVIAYSTCSQLGYMFFAAGLGLYGAAIFHLFTHAFFKALLFLGSGSVIHGMSDEQDMRKMGGLYKMMPATWMMMLIGTIALTGVGFPFAMLGMDLGFIPDLGFSGFFSKDAIIEGAFVSGKSLGLFGFWVGVIAALLTSFYSWRLIFMTFHGKFRGDKQVFEHVHESPPVMMIPLVLLAVGAMFAGGMFKDTFIGSGATGFWSDSIAGFEQEVDSHIADPHAAAPASDDHSAPADTHGDAVANEHADSGGHHDVPTWVILAPFFATLFGLIGAWWFYVRNQGMGERIAAKRGPVWSFLYNKWYFDEAYNLIFVRGARGLGDLLWKVLDVKIVDGLGPNGVAATTLATARRVAKAQTGYLYHYAFVMLIGVVGLTLWIVAGAGGQ